MQESNKERGSGRSGPSLRLGRIGKTVGFPGVRYPAGGVKVKKTNCFGFLNTLAGRSYVLLTNKTASRGQENFVLTKTKLFVTARFFVIINLKEEKLLT